MRRRALLAAALVAACAPSPDAPPTPPSMRCVGCHRPEYERHHLRHGSPGQETFPPTCAVCHTERTWHDTESRRHGWPLTGAHARTRCDACHRPPTPAFEGTPTACVACHADDRARADRERPSHRRVANACATCHGADAWKPAHRRRDDEPDDAPQTAPAATEAPTPPAPAAPSNPAAPATRPRSTPRPAPPSSPATPREPATPTEPAAPAEREHPEARFPITRGNHDNISCGRCHSRGGENGRGNTDCVQCHPRSDYDDVHARVRSYPTGSAAPNFCVSCHTRGTRSRR